MNVLRLLRNILSWKKKKVPETLNISRLNINDPTPFALHSGEGSPGKDHLNTWVPIFQKAGVKFCIITRTEKLFAYAKKAFPSVPVVFAKGHKDLEKVFICLGSLRIIFYLSNTANAALPVRFNQYTHAFLGHGDSEKTPSAHKAFRMYDEIWAAGQAHIDRFQNAGFAVGHLAFVKIGRPMLKKIHDMMDTRPWQERFPHPTLCYLPTWEGAGEEQNYSSLPLAKSILASMCGKYPELSCAIKVHPVTSSRNSKFKTYEKELIALKKKFEKRLTVHSKTIPMNNLLLTANMFLCDVSSVITDCLLLDAPIFVYMKPQTQQASSSMPLDTFAYTFSDEDELMFKADKVLQGDDYLAPGRIRAREYYLGLSHIENDDFIRILREKAGTAWEKRTMLQEI